jgi:hypothetical protein
MEEPMIRNLLGLAIFVSATAGAAAGPVEDDWARSEQVRGRPGFESWADPQKEIEQSVLPSLDEQFARGRGLVEDARRRRAGVMVQEAAALDRLLRQRESLQAAKNRDPAAWKRLYLETRWAVRRIVFADPAWDFDKLLFVGRQTYCSSHIYTDHFDGSSRFGGNLYVLSPIGPEGKVTSLAAELSGGIFGRFDLSFDARRVVFAYKRPGQGYRIYEIGVDGRGLRQLTHDEPDEPELYKSFQHGVDDLDPCYLPDGRIVFTSTRSRRAVICTNNFTSTSLHVMDADGRRLRCLSGNTVNEFAPTVMHDGRVLYTRWEYVDKGAGDVQSLWSVHPDGSHPAHVYKNNCPKPPTLIDARQLPGQSHLFVCTGAPHMPLAVGPLMLVDLHRGQTNPAAMTNLTPEIALPLHYGYPGAAQGFYKEPYPLTEKIFLVAYHFGPRHDDPAGYGLYAFDTSGHREHICRGPEPGISCWQPIPLRPRPVPPVIPSLVETAEPQLVEGNNATLFLQDVYAGMKGIERGRVTYLRVMEDVPKPWGPSWCSPAQGDTLGLQNPAISLRGHFVIKRVHGIVPVRDDGSALFTVPPGRNLYFQALDANHMELQRMRTFVNLMPGELRSCVGCHEPRRLAPSPLPAMALAESPRELVPQPGESVPRVVHYPLDVQPALDRHCVRCHSATKPDGGLDLSGEMTALFSKSYENLIHKGLINHIDSDPRDNYIPAEPPLTFGSHKSKVVEVLLKGHYDAKLSREEFIRLVTWIDANAPFYGVYEGKKNLRWKDSPDFRPMPPQVVTQR